MKRFTKQPIKTPEIKQCFCGAHARLVDWDFRDMWRVMCNNNHTLTKECGTKHRAVCRWNARVEARLNEA